MLLLVQILIIALVLVSIFTKKVRMLSILVATILFLLTFPNTFPNIGMNIYLIMLFLAFLFSNLIDSFIRPLSYAEEIIIKDNKSDESDKSDKPDNSTKIQLIGIIVGSVVGGLVLIGIIIFIVVKYCKRKKDTIDDISGNDEDFLGIN